MIDMKTGPVAQQGTMLGANVENTPNYPYGLRLHFDSATLKKLAMGDGNMPHIGQPFCINALCEVVAVSMDDGQSEVGYSMTLQITAMDLCQPGEENEAQLSMARVERMFD